MIIKPYRCKKYTFQIEKEEGCLYFYANLHCCPGLWAKLYGTERAKNNIQAQGLYHIYSNFIIINITSKLVFRPKEDGKHDRTIILTI